MASSRCPICDAPIYADEQDCHYCGGQHNEGTATLDLVMTGLAGAFLLLLALGAVLMPAS